MGNHSTKGEQGSATMWAILLAMVVLLFAGLVIDGGYAMADRRDAARVAEQAARAGADELDPDSLRTGGFEIDPQQGAQAARQYLSNLGEQGTVTVNGTTVSVTVRKVHKSVILSAFGKGSFPVEGHATARSVDIDSQ